jgi:hypothetical protein
MIIPSDLDWRDSESVVVPEQQAIAVYTNVNDVVVVRQERAWDEDSDTIVLIHRQHVLTVVEAMLAEIGMGLGEMQKSTTAAKDPTAAHRQRRRGERLRDSHGDDAVTNRDADEIPPDRRGT